MDLHLALDPSSRRQVGIERALREAIRTGRLAPQSRLPSTRALAAELGVARGTVSAAYDRLVAEGYLSARVGSGTVVAWPGPAVPEPVRPESRSLRTPGPRYDLGAGSPDVASFPVAAWIRSTRRALARAPHSAYGYDRPHGSGELRTALASYLGRVRGVRTTPEQIVVASGYVQAVALLARVIAGTVAMEDPCYSVHREAVRRNGCRVVGLPVDDQGARTDLLAAGALGTVDAVVVTPAHQYPLGVTMHPDRRRAVTTWAAAHDAVVIEDDYDGEFRYDRQPVGALQGTAPDQVVYIGTASKTLAPALRLAWMVLPERLVEPVADAKLHLDLHTETIGQLTLADMLTSHAYDAHVRSMRLRYRRRRDLLVGRLDTMGRLSIDGIAAGLHVTVGLPDDGPDEEQVRTLAAARRLHVGALGNHWHAPGRHRQGLIVGYSTPSEGVYPRAVDALVRVLATAMRGR